MRGRAAGGIGAAASAVALALVLLLATAAAAPASDWAGHPLSGEGSESQLFGISCPNASLCVAVGGNNTIASSVNPLAPGDWKSVYVAEGVTPGNPNQRQLKGVSCPSAQLCVAVSFLGRILTSTEPTGGPSAWSVADFAPTGPNIHFYGVSCPSNGFCVAVAGGGTIATSTDPTGGAGAWTVTHLPAPLELRAVSCDSPSFCVAAGDSGTEIRPLPTNQAEVVSSTAPAAGLWQQTELPGSHGGLFGVSCPTTSFCLSGDMFGTVVGTTAPLGSAAGWTSFSSGVTVQITGASCGSPSWCLMTDNNGDVLTSAEPLAGTRAWTVQNLIPFSTEPLIRNALFSASCPSIGFCAVGGTGEVLTSVDPTAPPPPTVPKGGNAKKTKKHKLRPRRPRVLLLPGQSTEQPVVHGRAFLQFRFHVKRKFQVRGYVCSFDGSKMRRCRSPQRFRVGPDHHRFRVRAVGWTGLRGPVAGEPVWVCRRAGPTGGCRHPSS